MNDDPAKHAWRASVEIAGTPPLDDVRAGADRFYRFVRWRNLIEYAACVAAVVIFSWYIVALPHILQKVGSAIVVAATLYVAWQLHRRASAEPPERAGAMPLFAFLRAQLVRQRDALSSMFWWYLLPFLPGLVLVTVGSAGARAGETFTVVPLGWAEWLFLAGVGALFAGILWLNQRIVRKLQRHIDEIDALTGGDQ